jgi:hypothetical protein
MVRAYVRREGLVRFPPGARVVESLPPLKVKVALTKTLKWPKPLEKPYGREKVVEKSQQYYWNDTEPWTIEGLTSEGAFYEETAWKSVPEGTLLKVDRREIWPWARNPDTTGGQHNLTIRYRGEEVQWHRVAAFYGESEKVNCRQDMTWPTFQKKLPLGRGQTRRLHVYEVAHSIDGGHSVSLINKMQIKRKTEHRKDPRPSRRA